METEFRRFVRQLEKIEMETKIKKIKINPKDNAKWWYNLSLEDKQKAFYAVISRMHKAEIQENNSENSKYSYSLSNKSVKILGTDNDPKLELFLNQILR